MLRSQLLFSSQVIFKRAQSLRSTNLILKEEPQSLHIRTISHPLRKLWRIGVRLLKNLLRTRRRRDILPSAPAHLLLILIAQHVVVQQLGSLRVRCVLQDGAGLRPGDEGAFGGDSVVVAWGGLEGVAGGEGCYAAAIGGVEEGAWCS